MEFKKDGARFGKRIQVNDLLIDGTSISPIVIKDRTMLSEEGLFVVVVPIDKAGNLMSTKVDVVTRGFIYVKASQALMNKSRQFIEKSIKKHWSKKTDWNFVRRRVEADVERFLYKETARRPLVIVHGMNV